MSDCMHCLEVGRINCACISILYIVNRRSVCRSKLCFVKMYTVHVQWIKWYKDCISVQFRLRSIQVAQREVFTKKFEFCEANFNVITCTFLWYYFSRKQNCKLQYDYYLPTNIRHCALYLNIACIVLWNVHNILFKWDLYIHMRYIIGMSWNKNMPILTVIELYPN